MIGLTSVFKRGNGGNAQSPGGDADAGSASTDKSPPPDKAVDEAASSSDLGNAFETPTRPFKVPLEGSESAKEYLLRKSSRAFEKSKNTWTDRAKQYSLLDWAAFVLPCVGWLRTYKWRQWFFCDLVAGLSVGAMVIPQGISYAQLAGLPSVFGLYGAFVPVWVYSALGSSRQLAVGPVAVTSMLLFAGINDNIFRNPNDNYNTPSDPAAQEIYNKIAIQIAFLAGIMYTAFGLLRLGWLTNFLSHAVIAGFTTGAATIIGLSQARLLFGYNRWYKPEIAPVCVGTSCVCPNNMRYDRQLQQCFLSYSRSEQIYSAIADLIEWHSQFKWQDFVMSVSWLIILITFKECGKRVKRLGFLRALGPITVIVIAISITNIFKLYNPPASIRVVGNIPKGLPPWTGGWIFPIYNFRPTLYLSILICLIDVMESTAIATTLANKNKYQLNYTQELRGLGIANVVGSLTSCYTTTGSFSRSAVNDNVGAKTALAQFTSGTLVLLVLLVITPVFKNLPQNALGAIVISAVIGLWDFHAPVFYWRVSKLDLLVYLTALLVTLFWSIEAGLVASIGLSLLLVLFRVAFPHSAELGQLPGTDVYRNLKQYPEATRIHGLCMVRLDAPLYFANLRPMRERLEKYERSAQLASQQKGIPMKYVILDMAPITDMDGAAVHWVENIVDDFKARNLTLVVANPSKKIMQIFANGRLNTRIGNDNIFVRMSDAVAFCRQQLSQDADNEAAQVVSV